MEKTEIVVIVVVAVAVFAGVYYLATHRGAPSETLIENNLLVKSDDPVGDIQKRVPAFGEKAFIEQDLFPTNDSRNSAIAIMSAEIARGLALQGRNASSYAIIPGGQDICGTSNCTGASIVVRVGGCNCMFFNEKQVVVEGDEKFLIDQSVRTGRLVGFALFKEKSQ